MALYVDSFGQHCGGQCTNLALTFRKSRQLSSRSLLSYYRRSVFSFVFPRTQNSGGLSVTGAFIIRILLLYKSSYAFMMEACVFACSLCAVSWLLCDQGSVAKSVSSNVYANTRILIIIPEWLIEFYLLDRFCQ